MNTHRRIWGLLILFTSVFAGLAHAAKLNGVDIRSAEARFDGFKATFKAMRPNTVKGMTTGHTIGLIIENAADREIGLDPYLFSLVDTRGKKFDVKSVHITKVKKGSHVKLVPGASKEFRLRFNMKRHLDRTKPTSLYYGDSLVGKFTR
jgi:hypothetical protein